MIDAIYLIVLGIITILFGAKGFFGGLFVIAGLYVLRFTPARKFKAVRKLVPGKSFKIEVKTSTENIKLAFPLMAVEVLKPLLMVGAPIAFNVMKEKKELKNLDIGAIITALSSAVDVIYTFEGEIVSVETPSERIKISVE